jgi:hypothetical protein
VTRLDPKKLSAAGWERRCVLSAPRLGEAVEMYEELGFEVLLVPFLEAWAAGGDEETCTSCLGADEDPARFQLVYTRPRQSGPAGGATRRERRAGP